jgi:hypothetical protein
LKPSSFIELSDQLRVSCAAIAARLIPTTPKANVKIIATLRNVVW